MSNDQPTEKQRFAEAIEEAIKLANTKLFDRALEEGYDKNILDDTSKDAISPLQRTLHEIAYYQRDEQTVINAVQHQMDVIGKKNGQSFPEGSLLSPDYAYHYFDDFITALAQEMSKRKLNPDNLLEQLMKIIEPINPAAAQETSPLTAAIHFALAQAGKALHKWINELCDDAHLSPKARRELRDEWHDPEGFPDEALRLQVEQSITLERAAANDTYDKIIEPLLGNFPDDIQPEKLIGAFQHAAHELMQGMAEEKVNASPESFNHFTKAFSKALAENMTENEMNPEMITQALDRITRWVDFCETGLQFKQNMVVTATNNQQLSLAYIESLEPERKAEFDDGINTMHAHFTSQTNMSLDDIPVGLLTIYAQLEAIKHGKNPSNDPFSILKLFLYGDHDVSSHMTPNEAGQKFQQLLSDNPDLANDMDAQLKIMQRQQQTLSLLQNDIGGRA